MPDGLVRPIYAKSLFDHGAVNSALRAQHILSSERLVRKPADHPAPHKVFQLAGQLPITGAILGNGPLQHVNIPLNLGLPDAIRQTLSNLFILNLQIHPLKEL